MRWNDRQEWLVLHVGEVVRVVDAIIEERA
jgi:hypothetical protein